MKRQLAKCLPWVYFELIRSDILGPTSVNPSWPPVSKPYFPFVMKPSREGPSILKPTWEELQARVESLAKKKMKEGIALELRGTRTHCLPTWSSPLGSYCPSYGTLISRKRIPCPSRRLWPYRFGE